MTIHDALADAQKRQADLKAQHARIAQEAMDVNARGVSIEKEICRVEGEIRALMTIEVPVGQ